MEEKYIYSLLWFAWDCCRRIGRVFKKMNFNEAGLNIIKSFEGCKLQAYQDQKGIWSIGYGCSHHVTPEMCISQDEADARLKEDVEETANVVRNYILPHQINDNQFSACVSLAFNIGTGEFKTS